MIWYPVAGAGMSAVGTLATVLAFALPYWIQLEKSVDVTGSGVTDVYIKITHGLWKYCNLVTNNDQETEKCGQVQSHSDMDLVTECLMGLSIILSTNAVVQTVLYLSRLPVMSGQPVSLYLAMASALTSSLFLAAGLVVYGIADHDIRITDHISLEFSGANLHACYWLAVVGCVAIALSIIFPVLTLWNQQKNDEKDTSSLTSSMSSLNSNDSFTYRTKLSDRHQNTSSSSSESSDEEELVRAPHPYLHKAPIKLPSLTDIGVDNEVKGRDTDSILKQNDEADGESLQKLKVYISDSSGKLEEYERTAYGPEALTDIDDLSKHSDEERDNFYDNVTANVPGENDEKDDDQIKLSKTKNDGINSDEEMSKADDLTKPHADLEADETEKLPSADTTANDSKIGREADEENISIKLDLSGDRVNTPLSSMPDEKRIIDSGESEDNSDTEREERENQFELSGQQHDTTRKRKFLLTPIESTRSFNRELSNISTTSQTSSAFKYLIHHVSAEDLPVDSDNDDGKAIEEYPILFEKPVASAQPPADTRELFAPVILSGDKKSMFKLPRALQQELSHKRKTPKKPVFFDADRTKTTYDAPVWVIPQYPEVPFYKRKRKHGSPKSKKKHGSPKLGSPKSKKKVPSFKETIHFKKDVKQLPPAQAEDSEC